MKSVFLLTALLTFSQLKASIDFDTYFFDKSLRVDYIIGGNSESSHVFFEQMKEEKYWGGSKIHLIDNTNLGDFRVMVYNMSEDSLLYSRGFSSLFYEWIFTDEAKKTNRSFYESVQIPFPRKNLVIKIQMRDKKGVFYDIFKMELDPLNYFIVRDKTDKYTVTELNAAGDYHKKLDIVILPEGYTEKEMVKFQSDCKKFMSWFFEVEPFKQQRDKICFRTVNAPSAESGCDIPGRGIWRNTVLNTHFYTFNSDRYLTTQDIKAVRDLAAYVPYDQIYILVNTDTYGGGGVFNYYNLCTSDHAESKYVFTHEFGHAFAALADEYQYGYDKAEDLYDMSVEPWQVNITNLVDFNSKWKSMLDEQTPVPTPDAENYRNKIGAFEGAGYVKKGIFRPTYDCKMRSNHTDTFCPVCLKAVTDLLKMYTE